MRSEYVENTNQGRISGWHLDGRTDFVLQGGVKESDGKKADAQLAKIASDVLHSAIGASLITVIVISSNSTHVTLLTKSPCRKAAALGERVGFG